MFLLSLFYNQKTKVYFRLPNNDNHYLKTLYSIEPNTTTYGGALSAIRSQIDNFGYNRQKLGILISSNLICRSNGLYVFSCVLYMQPDVQFFIMDIGADKVIGAQINANNTVGFVEYTDNANPLLELVLM